MSGADTQMLVVVVGGGVVDDVDSGAVVLVDGSVPSSKVLAVGVDVDGVVVERCRVAPSTVGGVASEDVVASASSAAASLRSDWISRGFPFSSAAQSVSTFGSTEPDGSLASARQRSTA